mmetsp:Transcript_33352/g.78344  ORF Transcript_33352/g.78344 Transcript_33352/m.78344 type:complete len:361 (+) Transcript_33352:412-1494(+)
MVKVPMSSTRSPTASSISPARARSRCPCSRSRVSWICKNSSSESVSRAGSRSSKRIAPTTRIWRSMRFSVRSRTRPISSLTARSPALSTCRKPSMFIEAHVSVERPGWNLRSSSASSGRISGRVITLTHATRVAYSLSAWSSCAWYALMRGSWKRQSIARSGTATPMRERALASAQSRSTCGSRLIAYALLSGWRTSSVAMMPARCASMALPHASVHRYSNSISVRAIRLYILTVFFASRVPIVSCALSVKTIIGPSIRSSSWRAHAIAPATGGVLRPIGGAVRCASYMACTASRSAVYLPKMAISLLSRSSRSEARCMMALNWRSSAKAASVEAARSKELLTICSSAPSASTTAAPSST